MRKAAASHVPFSTIRTAALSARVLTRNVNSPKAQEFARLGAEVVAVDVDDPASLKKAFAGAYGAYCVTFFWEHFSVDREMAEAKAMAEAARSEGLKHVIWSTLEDTRKWVPLSDDRMPTLQGKYKVPHLDGKGESEPFLYRCRRPDNVSAHIVLLGQFHSLRHGARDWSRRQARHYSSHG